MNIGGRGNLRTFFLHPKPAAPPSPRPFFSAENQALSPPPRSSFPCFQPKMEALLTRKAPISSHPQLCKTEEIGAILAGSQEQWVETHGPQPLWDFLLLPRLELLFTTSSTPFPPSSSPSQPMLVPSPLVKEDSLPSQINFQPSSRSFPPHPQQIRTGHPPSLENRTREPPSPVWIFETPCPR